MSRLPMQQSYISAGDCRIIKELLHQVIGGNTKAIAQAIGSNHQDMLNRISNQPRSPRKFEMVIAILDNVPDPEPFVRWFNLRYGFLPPIRSHKIKPTAETAQDQLIETVNELGDVSREFSCAYADRKVDPREADSIINEGYDLVQAVLGFIEIVRQIKENSAGGINGTT